MFLRGIRLLPPRAGMTAIRMTSARKRAAQGSHHRVLLLVGHPREERHRNGTIVVALGCRKSAHLESEARIVGLGMNGNVVDVHPYSRLSQLLEYGRPPLRGTA